MKIELYEEARRISQEMDQTSFMIKDTEKVLFYLSNDEDDVPDGFVMSCDTELIFKNGQSHSFHIPVDLLKESMEKYKSSLEIKLKGLKKQFDAL